MGEDDGGRGGIGGIGARCWVVGEQGDGGGHAGILEESDRYQLPLAPSPEELPPQAQKLDQFLKVLDWLVEEIRTT